MSLRWGASVQSTCWLRGVVVTYACSVSERVLWRKRMKIRNWFLQNNPIELEPTLQGHHRPNSLCEPAMRLHSPTTIVHRCKKPSIDDLYGPCGDVPIFHVCLIRSLVQWRLSVVILSVCTEPVKARSTIRLFTRIVHSRNFQNKLSPLTSQRFRQGERKTAHEIPKTPTISHRTRFFL